MAHNIMNPHRLLRAVIANTHAIVVRLQLTAILALFLMILEYLMRKTYFALAVVRIFSLLMHSQNFQIKNAPNVTFRVLHAKMRILTSASFALIIQHLLDFRQPIPVGIYIVHVYWDIMMMVMLYASLVITPVNHAFQNPLPAQHAGNQC